MLWAALPDAAAWRHLDSREGFEVVFLRADPRGLALRGHTTAVEDAGAWAVRYDVSLDHRWTTQAARAWAMSPTGSFERTLERDGRARWVVDGVRVPELDGCEDVDFESSACTNTIPIHRLALDVGDVTAAPAVYVRALDLSVQRMEQHYTRLESGRSNTRFAYTSPTFAYAGDLTFDRSGLVIDYPGLARRVA